MSQPKVHRDYKPLLEAAEAAGWTVTVTGKGHARLVPPPGAVRPDGEPAYQVTMPSSPGDRRSLQNTRRDMRRQGIPLP